MRVTMGMATKQYYRNLSATYETLTKAENVHDTGRKFDHASEDPVSSAKAYRFRREASENDDYSSSVSDLQSRLKTEQSSLTSIQSVVNSINSTDCLKGITGTTDKDSRSIIADKIRKLQASIVGDANVKYAGNYLFGGSGTSEPPFSVGDDGNLLYRGVDVNTGKIAAGTTAALNGSQISFGKSNGTKLNGYTIKVVNGATPSVADTTSGSSKEITVTMDFAAGDTNEDVLKSLKSQTSFTLADGSVVDLSKSTISGDSGRPVATGTSSTTATDTADLKALANEKSYVDIGAGLSFSGGKINEQSVFNSSMPGISFLGYGTSDGTSAGVSNNVYNLLGQIANKLGSSDFSVENIKPYTDALSTEINSISAAITKSGTDSTYLTTTATRLETVGDTTSDALDLAANVDTIESYEDYTAKYFAYQSALQVGAKLMQSTILDYMK